MRSIKRWTGLAMAIGISMPGPFATAGERAEDLAAPVRLEADGEPIDHGAVWGHAGPCVHDVDGDGKRDLVVGDFSGTFTFYRNVGTNDKTRYESAGKLMAGDEPAKVEIWCCIGASPQFADLNGDGHADLVSGSYAPGGCYWFPGNGDGTFQGKSGEIAKSLAEPPSATSDESGEEPMVPDSDTNGLPILDRRGQLILRVPDQVEAYQSYGSWPYPMDWDTDGDLDLLIGGFEGSVRLRENLGTNTKLVFSETPVAVEANGEPLVVKPHDDSPAGHAAVVVADWNGDELFDLVSGCNDGSVHWFKNTGEKGKPQFAAAELLVAPPQEDGEGRFLEPGEIPLPGIRSQVAVADTNSDGKLDLLVGDFSTTRSPREDLTVGERAAYREARDAHVAAYDDYFAANNDVAETALEFVEGYPKDAHSLEERHEKLHKRWEELRNEPEFLALQKSYESTKKEVERFLRRAPKGEVVVDEYATPHGFVWLYLRK